MNKTLYPNSNFNTSTSTAEQRFELAYHHVIMQQTPTQGIGTFKEKTIHALLKNFYSPSPECQEQSVEGYIADILIEHQIIEIQSRNFNTLRKKLETFLPLYHVTIVYPIAFQKWLNWIHPETGDVASRRKSPKKGQIYDIIPELYRIKSFLGHPHLHFILTFLDIEEYRLLNGWNQTKKRGSTRYDGIPSRLVDEIHLQTPWDFHYFLPDTLPQTFTTKDFQQITKISQRCASITLHILYHLGIIERIGKKGHAYLYRRTPQELYPKQND